MKINLRINKCDMKRRLPVISLRCMAYHQKESQGEGEACKISALIAFFGISNSISSDEQRNQQGPMLHESLLLGRLQARLKRRTPDKRPWLGKNTQINTAKQFFRRTTKNVDRPVVYVEIEGKNRRGRLRIITQISNKLN